MIDGPVAFAATCIVVARHCGDPFKKGRLSCPVLSHDDCNWPFEGKLELGAKQRQTKGVGACVGYQRLVQPDPPMVRRGEVNGTVSSAHCTCQAVRTELNSTAAEVCLAKRLCSGSDTPIGRFWAHLGSGACRASPRLMARKRTLAQHFCFRQI